MSPVHSTIPPRRVPMVNYTLIGANLACFAYETMLGARFEPFVWMGPCEFFPRLGARVGSGDHTARGQVCCCTGAGCVSVATSCFSGGKMDDRRGTVRDFCFYCLGGAVAVLVQICLTPAVHIPLIGASGAVAAVAGAYGVF